MAAFVAPLAIAGISALAGLFGNRKQKTEQESTQNVDMNTTSNPILDAYTQSLQNELTGDWQQQIRGDQSHVADAYTTGIVNNENMAAAALKKNARSRAAATGSYYTPTRGGEAGIDQARIAHTVAAYNNQPLIAQQLQQQALQGAGQWFSAIPKGTATHQFGTNTTKGSTTTPSNMLGGALAGGGAALAQLYGQGAFSGEGGAGGGKSGWV